MNKFILTLCFLVVTLLHILLFIYYRNEILFTTTQNKPSDEIVQIQLSKTTIEKEKTEEKRVLEEQKKIKEIIEKKETLKKIETPKKEIIENKKEEIKQEKVEETTTQVENKTKIEENQKEILEEKSKAIEKKLIDDYSKRLREEINKNKNYPTISKKLKEEGEVFVSFRVLKDGTFTNINLQKSSGKQRLDNSALEAIEITKQFEPFNAQITKEYIEYNLPLLFTLE